MEIVEVEVEKVVVTKTTEKSFILSAEEQGIIGWILNRSASWGDYPEAVRELMFAINDNFETLPTGHPFRDAISDAIVGRWVKS